MLCTSVGLAQEPLPYPPPPDVVRIPAPLGLSPRLDARQRALELDLTALAARDEGRVLNGALQATLGAGFVTAGIFVDGDVARSLLILFGAGALAHGTILLTMVPKVEKLAQTYTQLPRFTPGQVRARIEFGERTLDELARAGRRTRIVDGTVTMLVASSYVPLWSWLERREDPEYRFGDSAFDYVGLAISTVNFATGLVTALLPSEAERRARAYRSKKDRFEREAPRELEQLSLRPPLGVAVQRSGITVLGRFCF